MLTRQISCCLVQHMSDTNMYVYIPYLLLCRLNWYINTAWPVSTEVAHRDPARDDLSGSYLHERGSPWTHIMTVKI